MSSASYTWTVDTIAPVTNSVMLVNASPTSAASVDFTVTFSESVSSVDVADFSLTVTGITDASILDVTGSGVTRTVTVDTGTGSGTIRLDIPNTATVTDLAGNSLASLPFTAGEFYTINSGRIWYVATTGSNSNSCKATTSACLTINGAIGKAAAGDTIEVATGTYLGTGLQVVLLNKSLNLSGGWNAAFTASDGMSTIDGEGARRGITVNKDITTTLDHFIVQNGFAAKSGGGIYSEGTTTISNSSIENNTAADYGGGIYNYDIGGADIYSIGSMTLNNSTVSNNTAGSGGNGIYNCCDTATMTLNNSIVSGNHMASGASYSVGGGIYNHYSALTLNNSVVSGNTANNSIGGGIYSYNGDVRLNTSTVTGNTAGSAGGGIYSWGDMEERPPYVRLNNSTVSDNVAGAEGGGIVNRGETTLTGSTISGNTSGKDGGGIVTYYFANVKNSTISGNTSGTNGGGISDINGVLWVYSSTITNNSSSRGEGGGIFRIQTFHEVRVHFMNTLLAGNSAVSGADCFGPIRSNGYNLIGNNLGCAFSATTGDQVGTNSHPINPRLKPLQNNGGATFTHALMRNSPAFNAGNPATPGSGGTACLAVDQRGVARPLGGRCDIGAYELDLLIVESIKRASANPTNASLVSFTVTFLKSVTGVDTIAPFNDFSLTTTGITGASIVSVSGSGTIYTVIVNTGSAVGNGTIQLNVVDDDSIHDLSGKPLGGKGIGNGSYTSGEVYSLVNIPPIIYPVSGITDTTPTYKWGKISGATSYQYQLLMGTTIVYTKTVASSVCTISDCSATPSTILNLGSYRWRVRAKVGGVWKSYSPYTPFRIIDVK